MVLWENAGQKQAIRTIERRSMDERIWKPLCLIRAVESNRDFDILEDKIPLRPPFLCISKVLN